ncbi:MAG: hypothetical protein ACK55I_24915, partial [bacterium]
RAGELRGVEIDLGGERRSSAQAVACREGDGDVQAEPQRAHTASVAEDPGPSGLRWDRRRQGDLGRRDDAGALEAAQPGGRQRGGGDERVGTGPGHVPAGAVVRERKVRARVARARDGQAEAALRGVVGRRARGHRPQPSSADDDHRPRHTAARGLRQRCELPAAGRRPGRVEAHELVARHVAGAAQQPLRLGVREEHVLGQTDALDVTLDEAWHEHHPNAGRSDPFHA